MTTQTHAATLRYAVLPRAGLLTDALLIAGGAGLIAASAQVSFKLPFTPVPITGQTFSVLLVGASLGTVRGGASGLLYVLLGLLFPVYAGGGEGWRKISSAVGAMLTGNVVIYLFGLPWLAVVLNTNLEKTLEYGLYPFVPGDTFKLYLAAAALPGAWKLVGAVARRTGR